MRNVRIISLLVIPFCSISFCAFWYFYSFQSQPTLLLTPTPAPIITGTITLDDPFEQSRLLLVDPPKTFEFKSGLNKISTFNIFREYEASVGGNGVIWYPNQKISYVFRMPNNSLTEQEIEFLLRTGRVLITTESKREREYINFTEVKFADISLSLNSPNIFLLFYDEENDGQPTRIIMGNISRDSDIQSLDQRFLLDYEDIDIQLISAGYLNKQVLQEYVEDEKLEGEMEFLSQNNAFPYYVNFRITNKTNSPIPTSNLSTYLADANNMPFPNRPNIVIDGSALTDTLNVGSTDLTAVYYIPLNVTSGYLKWVATYKGLSQTFSLQTDRGGPTLRLPEDFLKGTFSPEGFFVVTGIITTSFQEIEEYQVVAVQPIDFRLYSPYSDTPDVNFLLKDVDPEFWWEVRPDSSFPFTLTYQFTPTDDDEYIVFEFFDQPFQICLKDPCPQPPTPTPDPSIPTATPVVALPTPTPLPQP